MLGFAVFKQLNQGSCVVVSIAAIGVAGIPTTPASAETITMVYEGIVQGTFAGQPLEVTPFRLTAIAETEERIEYPGAAWVLNRSARLFLQEIGEFDILAPTGTWVYEPIGGGGGVQIQYGSDPKALLLYGTVYASELENWNIDRPVGPVTSPGCGWGFPNIVTSGGILDPTLDIASGTFSATVPEPAAFTILVTLGLGAAAALRRR